MLKTEKCEWRSNFQISTTHIIPVNTSLKRSIKLAICQNSKRCYSKKLHGYLDGYLVPTETIGTSKIGLYRKTLLS